MLKLVLHLSQSLEIDCMLDWKNSKVNCIVYELSSSGFHNINQSLFIDVVYMLCRLKT